MQILFSYCSFTIVIVKYIPLARKRKEGTIGMLVASRGGVTVTRKAHNLEIPGAIPGPAILKKRQVLMMSAGRFCLL